MITKQQIQRAFYRNFKRNESAQWEFGTIGYINADESVTVESPNGPGWVWVLADKGTYIHAFNRGSGAVAPQAGLRVRYRDEYGRKVIDGIDTSGPMDNNPNAPVTVYSVNGQTGYVVLDPDDLDDTSTTNKFTTAAEITKLAGIEALADVTDAGNIASSITGVATDDTIVDADIWGYLTGGVLVKTAWSNIKAVLKTYFDTIYTFAAIVADNSITNAKLRDSGALSVIGRSANSSGDPADISATAATDAVLRESGSALGFGTVATGGIANSAVTTAKILDANVTLAKLANIATDSLIGRDTASSGVPENILLNATLSMDGSGNLQRAALTGDVAASAGSNTTAIGTNKVLTAMINDAQVTLAKMANLAADTIIGRANGAGTGVPTALTATQVVAIIQSLLDGRYGQLAAANTWTANNAFNSTATSGSALSATRNLTATSTDAPVVSILQDHASDDQSALLVSQDGQGSAVEVRGPNAKSSATVSTPLTMYSNDSAATALALLYQINGNAVAASRYTSIHSVEQGTGYRALVLNPNADVLAVILRAFSAAGLTITDDGGNTGIFVEDGGRVGVGTSTPVATESFSRLTVQSADNTAHIQAIINTGTGQNGLAINRTGGTASRWVMYIPAAANQLHFYSGTLADAVLMLTSAGLVGIGTTAPQGKLHVHDGTGGKLLRTVIGVVGSEVELIADGTGDVAKKCIFSMVASGSGGTMLGSTAGTLTTPGAASVTQVINTLTFKLYSTGQLVVFRSSGAETYSVTVDVLWQ